MSLVHPLLPKGREFTIRFSPSRRHLESDLCKNFCVFCSQAGQAELIPVPSCVCNAAGCPSPHYIHEHCLKTLQCKDGSVCPRCKDMKERAHINPKVSHPMYCQDVSIAKGINGFKASSKIQKVIEWVKAIPSEDKAIIYSFFEGSLDLLEGILMLDLGIDCARLDNDIDPADMAKDLCRFKTSPTCRILLATVQSCGSGFNIEEANHIAFLDR